jgi:hypothetical protein
MVLSMASFMQRIMGVLTADRAVLGEIANDDSATGQGALILLIYAIIGSIPQYLYYAEYLPDSALMMMIVQLAMLLLIVLLLAALLGFVLRGFGGSATTIQAFRMFSFVQIWYIIGSVILIVLSIAGIEGLDSLSFIFSLIALVILSIGLSEFSGISTVSAFIAVIIAYILAYILAIIIAVIVIVAILSAIL